MWDVRRAVGRMALGWWRSAGICRPAWTFGLLRDRCEGAGYEQRGQEFNGLLQLGNGGMVMRHRNRICAGAGAFLILGEDSTLDGP